MTEKTSALQSGEKWTVADDDYLRQNLLFLALLALFLTVVPSS